MKTYRILLIDDDPSLLRVTQFQLENAGYQVYTASTGEEGLQTFHEIQPELIVTDIKMPGMNGLDLLSEIKRISPPTVVIVITAHASVDTALQAMKFGAHDYLCKPFETEELLIVLEKAFEYLNLVRENVHLQQELLGRYRFENIIGGSEAMERVFQIIRRVSQTDSTVLLEGESGTGKELIARAIHYSSPRQKRPFIAVNCAAIPENLMESEFFGHTKGAFTGALNERSGKFELAHKGTIFLDEIADMRLDLQSKLLRVLQEKEIEKVGGKTTIPIDVRVISATNKNLKERVDQGEFREDLYYRLSVVPIRIPALRERLDDIPLLVHHFLQELGSTHVQVDADVYQVLQSYNWPGNVRELQNIIEQSLVLRQKDDRLERQDIPAYLREQKTSMKKLHLEIPPEGIQLEEVEKELIATALKQSQGNQKQAAKLLGITRQTLIYRMKKFEL